MTHRERLARWLRSDLIDCPALHPVFTDSPESQLLVARVIDVRLAAVVGLMG